MTPTPVRPSGDQVEISHAGQTLIAVTVGGGLRQYAHGGRPVLDGYDAGAMADGARGQLLMPWPNRVRDGVYQWDGELLRLPLTEPEQGNAIHGLARWLHWSVVDRRSAGVSLEAGVAAQTGYPFSLRLRVDYDLDDSGLTVAQSATNFGDTACPYGSGAHPYLTAGAALADDCDLVVPAAVHLTTDERQIPTGRAPVAGTDFDFREPRRIGDMRLDTAFSDLAREADGRARASVSWQGRAVTLWVDAEHTHLMVFTGDTLAPARRRRGIAIEPMTCPPNAFATGEGVRRLEAGERFAAAWGIEVSG